MVGFAKNSISALCGVPRHCGVPDVRLISRPLHALTLSFYRSLSPFVVIARRRSSLRRTAVRLASPDLGALTLSLYRSLSLFVVVAPVARHCGYRVVGLIPQALGALTLAIYRNLLLFFMSFMFFIVKKGKAESLTLLPAAEIKL